MPADRLNLLPLSDLVAKEPHDEEESAKRHVERHDYSHLEPQPDSPTAPVSRLVHSLVLSQLPVLRARRGVER